MFSKAFLIDLGERVVATYVAAFLTLEMADLSKVADVGFLKVCAIAAIPTALSVLKGVIASKVGDPNSASLLAGK